MPDSVSLFNPNDNVTGRDGGPYLDEVEARNAEARRSAVEDREPDYDNPPATAGIPLVSGSRQAAAIGVNNLPSQSHNFDQSLGELVQARSDDGEVANFTQRSEVPAEFLEQAEQAAEDAQSDEEEDEDSEDEGVEPNSHDPASPALTNEESDEFEATEADPEDLNYDSSPQFDIDKE